MSLKSRYVTSVSYGFAELFGLRFPCFDAMYFSATWDFSTLLCSHETESVVSDSRCDVRLRW